MSSRLDIFKSEVLDLMFFVDEVTMGLGWHILAMVTRLWAPMPIF